MHIAEYLIDVHAFHPCFYAVASKQVKCSQTWEYCGYRVQVRSEATNELRQQTVVSCAPRAYYLQKFQPIHHASAVPWKLLETARKWDPLFYPNLLPRHRKHRIELFRGHLVVAIRMVCR